MADFYKNLSVDDVVTVDKLSRLLAELRESRQQLLARHGAESEQALLERIRSGALPEHPAYDDYLGALTISTTFEGIRADLKQFMLDL